MRLELFVPKELATLLNDIRKYTGKTNQQIFRKVIYSRIFDLHDEIENEKRAKEKLTDIDDVINNLKEKWKN